MIFRTAFLDLLFNTLLVFVCLFAVAFLQMRPPTQPGKSIEAKAEFVLEMTWPDGSLDDIDLWLLLPDGEKVGFNRKDIGVATLDRDDRGAFGDVYFDGTQRKLIRVNREVIAVRGIVPGHFVVNAHYYGHFTEERAGFPDLWGKSEIPVKVKLTKLNPRVSEIGTGQVTLSTVGEQATAFAFDVDSQGQVSRFDTKADLPFVEVVK